MTDVRPPISSLFSLYGVPATITPPGGAPIATRVVWHSPIVEGFPEGAALTAHEQRRRLSIRKDQIATVKTGTVVSAVELVGGAAQDWTIDGVEYEDSQIARVFVR
jgi:hypothetical protein